MTDSTRRRLVDTNAAAVAAQVSPGTIRSWASRGYIDRAGTDRKGRALYDLGDVYKATVPENRPRKDG